MGERLEFSPVGCIRGWCFNAGLGPSVAPNSRLVLQTRPSHDIIRPSYRTRGLSGCAGKCCRLLVPPPSRRAVTDFEQPNRIHLTEACKPQPSDVMLPHSGNVLDRELGVRLKDGGPKETSPPSAPTNRRWESLHPSPFHFFPLLFLFFLTLGFTCSPR